MPRLRTIAHEIAQNLRRWTAADLIELAASAVGLVLIGRVFGTFASAIELRAGVVLRDPVLALLTPRDMTGPIFAAMYLSVVIGIVTLGQQPRALLVAVRTYAVMVLLRMVVMAATPFDAPPGTIPLADPVVRQIATSQILTRDLFFSGHTATVCVLVYTARSRALRAFFVLVAVAVGAAVLLQAVHYTVDVLAAPIFTYAAYRFAVATTQRQHHAAVVPAPVRRRGGAAPGVGREPASRRRISG